jgi:hypothetical protein
VKVSQGSGVGGGLPARNGGLNPANEPTLNPAHLRRSPSGILACGFHTFAQVSERRQGASHTKTTLPYLTFYRSTTFTT